MWTFIISLIVFNLLITSMICCEEIGNYFSLFCFTVFFIIILKHRYSESIKVWIYKTLFSNMLIVINKNIISFKIIFISAFFIWIFTLQILILCFFFFFYLCVFFYISVNIFKQRLLFLWIVNFHYIWFTGHSFWNSNNNIDNDSRSCELLCRMI